MSTDQIQLHQVCGLQAMYKGGVVHNGFVEGGVTIQCFLPAFHKYSRHHARVGNHADAGEGDLIVVAWGPEPLPIEKEKEDVDL